MLTISQINQLNALLPGEHIKFDGVRCLRGMIVTKRSPDGHPLETPRENDVYFTLYM